MTHPHRPTRSATLITTLAAALLCVSALCAVEGEAEAGFLVGADIGTQFAVSDNFTSDGAGFNGALRLGYELPVPVIRVIGETKFTMGTFPDSEESTADESFRNLGVMAGGRVGLGGIIGPAAYFHVGYATLSRGDTEMAGLAWDAGLSLDFTLLPLINVGVHGGYVSASMEIQDLPDGVEAPDPETLGWIEAGVHAELTF